MGDYFVMSKRFNKTTASDFGFIYNDECTAINPKDKSVWRKHPLYDLGWGRENGFYKEPLPGFDGLIHLVLHSANYEDVYGAAAIILEKYTDNLLLICEKLANDCLSQSEFVKLVEPFDLTSSMNRSSICGKTYAQIQDDYKRWERISKLARNL